jgi:hypothetical protein
VIAAFEHEFVYTGIEDQPGHAYSLNAFRRQGPSVRASSRRSALRASHPTRFSPKTARDKIRAVLGHADLGTAFVAHGSTYDEAPALYIVQ